MIPMLQMAIVLAVQATLVLAIALVAVRYLRGSSASARHLTWSLTLGSIVALPLLTAIGPTASLGILPTFLAPAAPDRTHSGAPPVSKALLVETEPGVFPAVVGLPSPVSPSRSAPGVTTHTSSGSTSFWPALCLLIWGAGTLGFLARLACGIAVLGRRMRSARALEDPAALRRLRHLAQRLGVRRRVSLRTCPRVQVPMTYGVLRPAILVPAGFRDWTRDRQDAVLSHELAHVARLDCATQVMARIACALLWINPLVWHAARGMRREQERACDDRVLACGTRPSDYAFQLLHFARTTARPPAGAIAMTDSSDLEARLVAILDDSQSRHGPSRRTSFGAVAMTLVLTFGVAAVKPGVATSQRPARVNVERIEVQERGVSALKVLDHPDFVQRMAAIQALATEGNSGAVDRVIPVLADDPHPRVRQKAAWALGKIGDVRALDPLITAVSGDPADGTRQMAAWALGELGQAAAIEPLLHALNDPEGSGVRQMAAWALGEVRAEVAIPSLGQTLLTDEVSDVRQMAAWALQNIGDRAAIATLRHALSVDDDSDVRQMAALALGEMADEQALPVLMDALAGDGSSDMKQQAAYALGRLGNVRALGVLLEACRHERSDVRQQAVFALGRIGDARACDVLIELLRKDESSDVRQQAAAALARIGGDSTRVPLVEALRDSSRSVREVAARSLAGFPDPEIAAVLERVAREDSSGQVREAAELALKSLRDSAKSRRDR